MFLFVVGEWQWSMRRQRDNNGQRCNPEMYYFCVEIVYTEWEVIELEFNVTVQTKCRKKVL